MNTPILAAKTAAASDKIFFIMNFMLTVFQCENFSKIRGSTSQQW